MKQVVQSFGTRQLQVSAQLYPERNMEQKGKEARDIPELKQQIYSMSL